MNTHIPKNMTFMSTTHTMQSDHSFPTYSDTHGHHIHLHHSHTPVTHTTPCRHPRMPTKILYSPPSHTMNNQIIPRRCSQTPTDTGHLHHKTMHTTSKTTPCRHTHKPTKTHKSLNHTHSDHAETPIHPVKYYFNLHYTHCAHSEHSMQTYHTPTDTTVTSTTHTQTTYCRHTHKSTDTTFTYTTHTTHTHMTPCRHTHTLT